MNQAKSRFSSALAATPFDDGFVMTEHRRRRHDLEHVSWSSNTATWSSCCGRTWRRSQPSGIKTLTSRGLLNDCPFFRVIPGFMAQTGDPTDTGTAAACRTCRPNSPTMPTS